MLEAKTKINFYIRQSEYAWFKTLCEKQEVSMSHLLRQSIKEFILNQTSEKKRGIGNAYY
jgi:hypothetical protein